MNGGPTEQSPNGTGLPQTTTTVKNLYTGTIMKNTDRIVSRAELCDSPKSPASTHYII